jgi:hypothetical protein
MARFDGSTDAPLLILEVDPSSLSQFTLDQSTLGGPDVLGSTPAWTALPMTDVRMIATRRGRPGEDQPNDTGLMTVELDNVSANYDPTNTSPSNPYTTNGKSWWQAGLPIRLRATWGATTYPLFQGRLEEPRTDLGNFPVATFTCVDGMAAVSAQLTGYTPLVETTAQRTNRVLDLMGWPTADRIISGTKALLASGQTSSGTAVIEECAKAETGRFYVDASGKIRLTDRASEIARTVQVTLADDLTASSADYEQIRTSPGVKYVVNVATATNGTYSVTVTNTSSIAATRITKAVDVNVPLSATADLDSLATYLATHRATPSTRIESVEVEGLGIGTGWPGLLSVDLGDRAEVKRTGANGVGVDVVVAAEGVQHTITPKSWRIAFATAPVDVTGSTFKLDGSLLNGSDVLTA